jgi:hypothetical protein
VTSILVIDDDAVFRLEEDAVRVERNGVEGRAP